MYNLRSKRVNRHCTTETSCRAQDLGRGSCVLSELQSPSTSGGSSVMSSMATATTTTKETNNNPSQPAVDVSQATPVIRPETTKAGKPRKRMKWTEEMNSFIMRSYYKITKFETDMTMYRSALHRAFIEKFPSLQNITVQRIADQMRVIISNNLLPEPILQQIRGEIQLEMQREEETDQPDAAVEHAEEAHMENLTGDVDLITGRDIVTNANNYTVNNALEELHKALAEFDGTDPARRPRLPKLRTNKNTNNIINSFNVLLKDFVAERNTLEKLHALIYCAAVAVLRSHKQQVYILKSSTNRSISKKAPWQRRLEIEIEDIRREMGRITEFRQTKHPSKRLRAHIRKIFKKAGANATGPNHQLHLNEYMDTLRQKLKAKSKRLRRYAKCSKRKQQNRLFNTDQKRFYRELTNASSNTVKAQLPQKEQLTDYWKNIWSIPKYHNRNAHWMGPRMNGGVIPEMPLANFSEDEVRDAIKSTNNWKAPGVDGIQNFWYKKFPSLHEALAQQFSHVLHHPEDTPTFLMRGSTYMLPKSDRTEDPSQYRPITCLPTMYKILTSCISNRIYKHVNSNNVLAEEQKGCRKGHQGCKEQLIIDSVILKQAQKEQRNLYTAFIDYKKAFDSVPHSWLLEVLRIYNIHPAIVNFLGTIMLHWRTSLLLQYNGQSLNTDEIPIRRGIFQGDSLSPLWFCLAMNPLSTLLNDTKYGFKIKAHRNAVHTVSHLLYMDDVKLYAGNQKQLNNLINITHNFSKDIHMEFGMEKCKALKIEKGKIINGDMVLPNGDIIQAMEEGETYKYLGYQQARLLQEKQAKIKVRDLYLQRIRKLLKSELNGGNLITAINTYAIPVLTYTFGILKWTYTEMVELQRVTRTMMTKYKVHHPKASTLRTTLPRGDGGRALTDIINLHSRQLVKLREFFVEKARTSNLHEVVRGADKNLTPLNLHTEHVEIALVSDADKKDQWAQKALHGRHYGDLCLPHIDGEASNKWLSDGLLFPETEGFMIAIQDQVIGTNNYKKFVIKDPNVASDKCRKCNQKSETIQHITSGCTYLANSDYLYRHNQVCNIVHQKLANKYGLINTYTPYYKYQPQPVLENDSFRLYYDRTIITDRRVTNNRPDIVLMDKRVKSVYLIDVAIPNNNNMLDKYREKKAKYAELAIEIQQMWQMDRVEVIPIVVSSTGLVPKTLNKDLVSLGLHKNTFIDIQKAVILNTCHLVRKFLSNL